jgi:hypothetical protein
LTEIRHRIESLDISLFKGIESQTSDGDRRSLLALQAASGQAYGDFAYLEIGSHLGGSLQVLAADPTCRSIVSVDPRPREQPDARGVTFTYPGNSTRRMLEALETIPGVDLQKIVTIETGTADIDPSTIPAIPSLCFVDGEHTDEAALGDACFCARLMRYQGCIAFHDAWVIFRALRTFVANLENEGREHRAYVLPDTILVVELGAPKLLPSPQVVSMLLNNHVAYLALADRCHLYKDALAAVGTVESLPPAWPPDA